MKDDKYFEHAYDYSDFCLKDGELCRLGKKTYLVINLEKYKVEFYNYEDEKIGEFPFGAMDRIFYEYIKRDLIKDKRFGWFKNILKRIKK